MKKTLIAGAASVALAAMPVVGVFAATSSTFTDNIDVTVDGGCTIENAATAATNPGVYADRNFSKTIAAGTSEILTGTEAGDSEPATTAPALVVKCNVADSDNKTFNITAEGEALTHDDTTTTIPAGTATSGTTSAWAYTLGNPSDTAATWSAAPVAETTVVSNQAANTSTSFNFNPAYRVYVSPSQKPGHYAGSITYTVALND
ncbi:hypothetical protein IJ101_02290 [Candidatus Saccharibacteria bacterium]|nr:hypothetical protein [Candidatus Saccharibacteria bacterium]